MKKVDKPKLALKVETLRTLKTLQDKELQHIVGGLTTFISQCCAH